MERKLNWIQLIVAKLFKIPINEKVVYTIPDMINVGYGRCTGRSNRLVNMYVELLFVTGVIRVRDHHPFLQADACLFDAIMKRLRNEYPNLPIEFDFRKKEITLDRKELAYGDKWMSKHPEFINFSL